MLIVCCSLIHVAVMGNSFHDRLTFIELMRHCKDICVIIKEG